MPDANDRPHETVAPGAFTALLAQLAATPPSPDAEPPALAAGTVVGRFELVRELGRGGFGVVYEARDLELGRSVAFKLVRPGRARDGEAQLAREAEAIARLSHPNVVALHELGRSEYGPYLVLELLRGEPLHDRLRRGALPVREAVAVAVDVARGLAHAHADGVVHRDLNPSNVFLCAGGGAKILDFGMAHAFGRRRISGGTPAFMAPEQRRGAPEDERTDVFALGVLLYAMLAGALPFADDSPWTEPPEDAPTLDVADAPALGRLVARMLERDPVRRPRDGGGVLAVLERIAADLETPPGPGGVTVRRQPPAPARAPAPATGAPGARRSGADGDDDAGTASEEARRECRLGRAFLARGSIDGFRRAAKAFENAIAADPDCAAAHAGLANALVWLWKHRWGGDRPRLLPRARDAAERAVALDPASAATYLARARLRLAELDWAGARRDVDAAARIRPDEPWTLRLHAALLAIAGRLADAIAATRRALEVDPQDAYAWTSLGWYLLDGVGTEAARAAARRALEISPELDVAIGILAISFLVEGRPAEALAVSQRSGGVAVRLFGAALAHHDLGNAVEARKALDALVSRVGAHLPYRVAEVHAWRGDVDRAFEWLERAVAERDPTLGDVREDPLLAGLRGDPRYRTILQRVGVPLD